mmetsp:Transcript_11521/g.40255  ORF Transcript_11521/g.40255 Transcript_11521/m.40255 type:complete len:338 (+) Transcript_11521:4258-5271(+)
MRHAAGARDDARRRRRDRGAGACELGHHVHGAVLVDAARHLRARLCDRGDARPPGAHGRRRHILGRRKLHQRRHRLHVAARVLGDEVRIVLRQRLEGADVDRLGELVGLGHRQLADGDRAARAALQHRLHGRPGRAVEQHDVRDGRGLGQLHLQRRRAVLDVRHTRVARDPVRELDVAARKERRRARREEQHVVRVARHDVRDVVGRDDEVVDGDRGLAARRGDDGAAEADAAARGGGADRGGRGRRLAGRQHRDVHGGVGLRHGGLHHGGGLGDVGDGRAGRDLRNGPERRDVGRLHQPGRLEVARRVSRDGVQRVLGLGREARDGDDEDGAGLHD